MGNVKSRIWFIGKIIIAAAMMATVYGCGGSDNDAPSSFTFSVVNNSGITVTEFYLSPSTDPNWGPDRFSTDLPSGSTRVISGVAPCSVNFDFYGSNGAGTTWGPALNVAMPPCGGTYTLTLN